MQPAGYDFVMQGSFFAHRALMRDTSLLNELAHRLSSFSKEQLDSVRRWYEFYWNMMEVHHHAEDDILFLEVEKKMNQPSEVIEAMEMEHNRLQFLIDECRRLIGESCRGAAGNQALQTELSGFTAELLELFSGHIAHEEQFMLDQMTAHFTPAEQRRIEDQVKRKAPVRYLSYMIPWVQDALNDKERDEFNRSLPWSARWLNKIFWKEKYERICAPVQKLVL